MERLGPPMQGPLVLDRIDLDALVGRLAQLDLCDLLHATLPHPCGNAGRQGDEKRNLGGSTCREACVHGRTTTSFRRASHRRTQSKTYADMADPSSGQACSAHEKAAFPESARVVSLVPGFEHHGRCNPLASHVGGGRPLRGGAPGEAIDEVVGYPLELADFELPKPRDDLAARKRRAATRPHILRDTASVRKARREDMKTEALVHGVVEAGDGLASTPPNTPGFGTYAGSRDIPSLRLELPLARRWTPPYNAFRRAVAALGSAKPGCARGA